MRRVGRTLDRVARRVDHRAVGDVRGDRVVEQQHVLRHERDLRAQARERERRHVVAVDEQASRRRLVKARHEVDERRLAAARAADERHRLAGMQGQRHVVQRLALGSGIAQRDSVEAQFARGALERDAAFVRLDVAVEEPEDAFRGGEPALDRRVDARQRLDPLEQRQQCDDVGGERAEIEAAALALREREPDDDADGDRREHLGDRRARGARLRLLRHRRAERIRGAHRARSLVGLAAEHADDPVAADHLLEHVRHRAGARLHVARDAPQPAAEIADDDRDDRQDEKRHRRELPVDVQQPAHARRDRQRAADRGGDRSGSGRGKLVRVERELRLDYACRRDVVVRRRQPQQLVDQPAPQVEHDAVPGVRHPVFRDERADAAEHEHADHRERQPLRARGIGILEVVDDRDDEHRHDQVAGGDAHHAHDREAEGPPIRPDVIEKTPVETHPGHRAFGTGRGASRRLWPVNTMGTNALPLRRRVGQGIASRRPPLGLPACGLSSWSGQYSSRYRGASRASRLS